MTDNIIISVNIKTEHILQKGRSQKKYCFSSLKVNYYRHFFLPAYYRHCSHIKVCDKKQKFAGE